MTELVDAVRRVTETSAFAGGPFVARVEMEFAAFGWTRHRWSWGAGRMLFGYYDPHVPVIKPTREHAHWAGTRSVAWNKQTITTFDVVLIATNHACVNYQQLASWTECIVDTRNQEQATTYAKLKARPLYPHARRERCPVSPSTRTMSGG